MKYVKNSFLLLAVTLLLTACTQNPLQQTSSTPSPQPGDTFGQVLDTAQLKSDLNTIETSVVSGKPDTNALKKMGSDILSTTARILSDSGISKMYGNSNDPSVKAAEKMLVKMRNSIGMTPHKLDSLRKEATHLWPGALK